MQAQQQERTCSRIETVIHHFVWFARWPITIGLVAITVMQAAAVFMPLLRAEALNVPDVLQPVNTAILALLWWRVAQLEKFKERIEKRDDEWLREERPRRK